MRRKNNKKGFTLQEMLITVAIVVILFALAFIAVFSIRRSMKQTELDGIAKEVFIAAQNHLSILTGTDGYSNYGVVENPGDDNGYRYFVIANDYSGLSDSTSLLSAMLPFASLDETIRLGGSYIVRYEKSTGTILDVFYTEKTGTFAHTLSGDEFTDLITNYRDFEDNNGVIVSNKSKRRTYLTSAVLGWYGGASAKGIATATINTPQAEVINAERLTVKVTGNNASNVTVKLIVEGLSSKKQWSKDISNGAAVNEEITLDDITAAGLHFSEVTQGSGLIPGENLKITVVAYDNTTFSNVAYSAVHYTNSLFADSSSSDTAAIANIRHLENLDPAVSGCNYSGLSMSKAEQVSDLSWSTFKTEIGGSVSVKTLNGSSSETGTFLPVNPNIALHYDGQNHVISDVEISVSNTNAGLFGSLSGAKIENLELVDFKVEAADSGLAGALAGIASNSVINNVVVHESIRGNADTSREIKGATAAGGLIGKASGTDVTGSSASVYVSSAGNAGGLIGEAVNSGVTDSYVGGHTKDGFYQTAETGEAHVNVIGVNAGGLIGTSSGSTAVSYSYSTASAKSSSSSGASGGLIGAVTGPTGVDHSYATGLVLGTTTGEGSSAVTSARGTIAGRVSGDSAPDLTLTENRHFGIINDGMASVGAGSTWTTADWSALYGGVSELDSSDGSYDDFIKKNSAKAYAYDAQLIFEFKGESHMPSIASLYTYYDGTADVTGKTKEHYGDWPSPETKFINIMKTTTAKANSSIGLVAVKSGNGAFPAGSSLTAETVEKDSDAYRNYLNLTASALHVSADTLAGTEFIDITVLNNGQSLQPNGQVAVSIQTFDSRENGDLTVLHFGEKTQRLHARSEGGIISFETAHFSVFAILDKSLTKDLVASDGQTYRITVTYGPEAGIPENAELLVSEIKEGDAGYDRYIAESAEKLAIPAEKVSFARAFDITIRDPETGEEYQPAESIQVRIELLSGDMPDEANVNVVHFGEETEVIDTTVSGEAVEFEANGFSVYVVVADEGGKILTPRVEFHFLNQTYEEDTANPGTYSAGFYSFINKAGTMQNSQILKNGEFMEMISNPPNLTIDNGDGSYSYKYFYGWYIVEEQSVSDDKVSYTWDVDPEQIHFEKTITIDPNKIVWNNDDASSEDYHTAITSLVWEMDGVEHEVKAADNSGTKVVLDEYGCVHVYLAPIYEDYYFVNFHAGAIGSDLAQSIIVRKLVVLGNDGKSSVRIGDVQTESADSQHKIFTGWEGELWDDDDSSTAMRRHTTLDDVGEELYSGEGVDGYYIQVSSHDLYPGHQSVDLYPFFTEVRWFHFVTGKSGNGATYVADRYLYTTDAASEIENGTAKYYLTDLATSSRTGFAFKGWFANPTETDSNGDYIDGQQVTDENGQVVNAAFTHYDTDGITPLWQMKDGRLYVYKEVSGTGINLYAHWEEITETNIQVIVWRQKVSDDKSAFDYQKSYDFEAAYTIDTHSGMTLGDLRANDVLKNGATNYEALTFTGFHYRTTNMSTPRVKGDGSTVVNIYYDRDLMTIYYYYNSTTGEPAYTYTATTSNTASPQFGIVEGKYVELTPVSGSGTKYTFRYDYQRTTSDTFTPQFALVSHGSYKTYDELTREVNTVTKTRWHFRTGRAFNKTDRYMDQGTTDTNIFYVRSGSRYTASGYTLDDPPPANSSTRYYCRYNYNYYELDAQTTTTTTYTWKLNGVVWSGERYLRMSGTAEYTGERHSITGDNTNTYGVDTRGGYVQLDGTTVPSVTWYATTHTNDYYVDDSNDGLANDVYGLVDGEYVKLTPVLDSFSYSTANTYTETTASNTAQAEQYGLVDGEYVQLNWEVVGTTTGRQISYVYTPTTSTTSDKNYYIYRNGSFQNTRLYYNNGKWYRTRSGYWNYSYSDEWTGEVYDRTNPGGAYAGTVYGLTNNGEFTTYSSGTRYGDGGNGIIYQLGNQTAANLYGWVYNGVEYTGNRYLKGAGANWSGDRYTRTGSAAPYTYTVTTEDPSAGQNYYVQDSNENGAGNYGHVQLNWTASVSKYTYEDSNGNTVDYTGEHRYSLGGAIMTEYTGTRYTRQTQTGTYNRMQTYTGLYGQTLSQAGYTWPDQINGTKYNWYSQQNSGGSRLTFLDAFLFAGLGYATDNNTVLKLYGTANSQSGTYIYFYKQNLDGSYPALASSTNLSTATNAIPTQSGGTFTFTNKYDGFELDVYSTNNGGAWNNAAVNGSASTSNSGLHIRFKRKSYELIFEPNYPTKAGTTVNGVEVTVDNLESLESLNRVTESVKYEAPLSAYANQAQPAQAPDHYIFTGWYVDEGCTVKYEFTDNMDAANLRLFAGWKAVEFLIKIDPNGGEIDHIDHRYNNANINTNLARTGYSNWWWVDTDGNPETEPEGLQYSATAGYDPATWTPFATFNRTTLFAEDGVTEERPADNGWAATSRYSTYVNVTYLEALSEYSNLKCDYVPVSDAFAANYNGPIYYYMNTQFQSDAIDGGGLPSASRNALYMTETELHEYYLFYKDWLKGNLVGGFIEGATILDEETWRATYVSTQKYRHTTGTETYTFLGWYKLDADGNPELMPYNFSDPVTESFTIRAYWRLDAGYQIQYTPEFTMDDGTIINGSIPYWTDPEVTTSRYADEAATHIYRQPTGITANGVPTTAYIFRGWRLVNVSTNSQGLPVYTPIENNVFYDPGEDFTIRAAYADRNSVIHMQAYYEWQDDSYRRPKITNLVLDANGGFLTMDGQNELQSNTDLTSTWNGVVGTVAAVVDNHGVSSEIIEFGDIQSNVKVHLYHYATDLTHVGGDPTKAELHPAGKNYFKHPDGYFLLGFDDASNEGDYVATYPSDSIIGVQRDEPESTRTKYAVWEPMVYIKVVNATDVGPVTFALSSSEGAIQVVNARQGLYQRVLMSAAELSAITVEDGDYVWLAVPYGVVKQIVGGQETWVHRHITISGTNELGAGYLLSAKSELNGAARDTLSGSLTGTNADYTSVKNHKNFGFNEELVIDPEGIVITFTAVQNPHTLVLDNNYPTTGVRTEDVYFDKKNNTTNAYGYDVVYGESQTLYYDLPTTSSRVGYVFLGWDPSPTWMADHPDYKDTHALPTYTTGSAAGWRIASLTDFFKDDTAPDELESVKTLYAVWDNSSVARIVKIYKEVPAPGDTNKQFNFMVSLSGTYSYQRKTSSYSGWSSQTGTFNAGTETMALKDGEYLQIEAYQFWQDNSSEKPYIQAVVKKFDSTGTEIESARKTLKYTWEYYDRPDTKQGNYYYDFVSFSPSYSVTEDNYSAAPHYYDTAMTLTSMAEDTNPLSLAGQTGSTSSLPLTKDGRVVTWDKTDAGGAVIFTNTRQTADVTVKKVLESNTSVAGVFNFTASYSLSGVTTDLGSFSVTSGTAGHKLEDIPVGATLTVREVGTVLNDYVTTVKKGDTSLTVTETTSTSGSTTTYTRSVDYSVEKSDAEITFTNKLKSYPVTFYKVDQDGKAGVPSYFTLAASTGVIKNQLYPSQTGTGEFFPGTSGLSNVLYVGTYTLTETFISENYLPLDGPITLTLSADGGGSLTSSNTDYVRIEPVNSADLSQGFKVYVYNQRIVRLNIEKILTDPILNTTRVFTFRVEYEYTLLGNTVSNSETVSVTSGTSKEIKVPANATLTVTEVLGSLADTYDTTIQRKPETGTPDAEKTGTVYKFGSGAGCDFGVVTSANEGDTLTFTNTRKTIKVTVKKLIDGYDPADPERDDSHFTFMVTLLNGALPIANYPIDLNGTPDDGTDDLKTGSNGEYVFYLQHNGTKELSIPIGARLKVQETAASSTSAHSGDVPLSNYDAVVTAKYTENSASYTAGAYTKTLKLYDLNPVPAKDLTVTFTNGDAGKEIMFKKTDTSGNALAGAIFKVYTSYADAEAGNGSSGETGEVEFLVGDARRTSVISTNSFETKTVSGVTYQYNVLFKIPLGIYYLKEVSAPAGYDDLSTIYRLTVDADDFVIQRMENETTVAAEIPNAPTFIQTGIVNTATEKKKVILKKVSDSFDALQGAKFNIYDLSMNPIATDLTSKEDGSFFVGRLAIGYYYLYEADYPANAEEGGRWFTLEVTSSGAKVISERTVDPAQP